VGRAAATRHQRLRPGPVDPRAFLALGPEFQLASDVLRTAVAPSFRELGQLAAVAAIRTALNWFLGKEIAEERRQVAEEAERSAGGASGSTTAGSARAA
jgi:Protein of unknown function (DUF1622)